MEYTENCVNHLFDLSLFCSFLASQFVKGHERLLTHINITIISSYGPILQGITAHGAHAISFRLQKILLEQGGGIWSTRI
jgi:hypothetical protein